MNPSRHMLISSSNLSTKLVLTSIRRRKMSWKDGRSKEALIEKRAQLGESQTLQQFSRDADEIET